MFNTLAEYIPQSLDYNVFLSYLKIFFREAQNNWACIIIFAAFFVFGLEVFKFLKRQCITKSKDRASYSDDEDKNVDDEAETDSDIEVSMMLDERDWDQLLKKRYPLVDKLLREEEYQKQNSRYYDTDETDTESDSDDETP